MRLTTVILIATLMQVSAASLAQRVTLNQKNASLENVLKSLRQQTGYNVLYDVNLINKAKPVNLDLKDVAVEEAMMQILKGQELEYKIEEQNIIIKPKTPSPFVIPNDRRNLFIDAAGRILDESGKPLEGATVVLKGSTRTVKTDVKGEFVLANVPDDGVLVIRYVGYKQLEISLKDAVMPLEIKLNVATGELEEVKVTYSTGYQNIPKERATGSFVQISNEDINRGVSTDILDRIINITNSLKSESLPVGNTNITIRGLSTINASKKPLIVIDGFPYEESNNFGRIDLSRLNPNDVESITVLRDAAAASIWGARAGNGVIVITTKKGKFNQHSAIQFNSNVNISERPQLEKISIMSSADAIDYEKRLYASGFYSSYNGPFTSTYAYPNVSPAIEIMLARQRGAISQAESDAQLSKLAKHDVRDDIDKYLLQNSVNQQYNLNLSGGNDKMNYYASVGYDKNKTSNIGNNVSRLSILMNNIYRPLKKLELNVQLSYTQSKRNDNGIDYSTLLNANTQMAPYTMLADDAGIPLHISRQSTTLRAAYIDTLRTIGLLDWHYKPLDEIKNSDNTSRNFDIRIGGGIKYIVLPGLNVAFSGRFERALTNIQNYYSLRTFTARNLINQFMFISGGIPQYPIPLGGILDYTVQEQKSYDARGQANLDRTWGDHHISAIAGMDIGERLFDSNRNRKYGYDPLTLAYATNMDYKNRFNTRPSGSRLITEGGFLEGFLNRFQNYYSNAAYTYLNKYTITASARIDASNFFGVKANLKRKPFWSVGALWNIDRERFFKPGILSSLKVRATYGFNGNMDNTATALPTIRYSAGFSPYNNSQQYAELSTPPNPGLSWEKIRQINMGLDFALFNSRITGTLEYYAKKGTDLIGSPEVDPTTGTLSYKGNYAGMTGKGIDFTLNGLVINRKIKLNTLLNFSYNTDKVTDLFISRSTLLDGNSYIGGSVILGTGLSPLYSYRWGGLNGLTGDPMGVVNGQIVPFTVARGFTGTSPNTKPSDVIYHGSTRPLFFGNILNSLSYNGFSASFNVDYNFKYFFRRPSVNFSTIQSTWSAHGDYAYRWQKPGDELFTNVPSMPVVSDTRYSFYSNSEILVERGDHIRLRDIRLSYSLNKIKTKRSPFNNATAFIYANNLGVFLWRANDKKIDPSFVNMAPAQRSIALGLTVNY